MAMNDSYKVNQGGAVGPGAHAHDMTFNQYRNTLPASIDLKQLAANLATLRQEMRKQAADPDHDIAISDIAKAEKAAKEDNRAETTKYLTSAGKWALDVATKIGASLAVEALKGSLGMSHS